MVSSLRLARARPPQAMNAIRNLLFSFWPRRIAGAPVTTPAAATALPTNSRRVIRLPRIPLLEFFISLAPPNPRILRLNE
jgi:hypothetical protein